MLGDEMDEVRAAIVLRSQKQRPKRARSGVSSTPWRTTSKYGSASSETAAATTSSKRAESPSFVQRS